jgi:hypothetical protein|tara:strand:+ start:687 stop:1778 length:1092 start_codon:yes stop_codon:yes gene_type:complete
MNMDEQIYHSIDAYLSGELQGRKLDEFKAELRTNEDLQESVTIQEKIISAINAERDKELKEYLIGKTRKKVLQIAPIYRTWMLTAAAIALLIAAAITLIPYINTTPENNTTAIPLTQKKKTTDSKVYEPAPLQETKTTTVDTQTLAIAIAKVPDDTEPEDENVISEIEDEDEFTEPLDKQNSDDMITSVTETDKTTGALKINTPVIKNIPPDQPIAIQRSTDIEVRGDELLVSRRFTVPGIEPDFSIDATRLEERQKDSATGKKKNENKNISTERENFTDYAATSREVEVEYWKSVVNYKGYQYDGTKVKLYGIDKTKTLSFKELDSRLYLKSEGKQYFLEKNKKYNRLVEVTNPTLLKVIND